MDGLWGSHETNSPNNLTPTQTPTQAVTFPDSAAPALSNPTVPSLSNSPTLTPTSYPSSLPTPAPLPCTVNGVTLPNLWQGPGVYESDMCHMCKCLAGTYTCSSTLPCVAGVAVTKIFEGQGSTICSHVQCKASSFQTAQGDSSHILVVKHHHAEQNGETHNCAYNQETDNCVCFCFDEENAEDNN